MPDKIVAFSEIMIVSVDKGRATDFISLEFCKTFYMVTHYILNFK